MADIVKRGGRCLIPVFALGRAQELLLILGGLFVWIYMYSHTMVVLEVNCVSCLALQKGHTTPDNKFR